MNLTNFTKFLPFPFAHNILQIQFFVITGLFRIARNDVAVFLLRFGVLGAEPLGERVAALRQAQGPFSALLPKDSEGETSPIILTKPPRSFRFPC